MERVLLSAAQDTCFRDVGIARADEKKTKVQLAIARPGRQSRPERNSLAQLFFQKEALRN
jgi:hypothetical protein